MRTWNLPIALPESNEPIFLRIARTLVDDVRRGRLRPGDAIPGSRTLAGALGVHRNTVLAAYRELEAEGWLEARPAGGTFVSTAIPDAAPRRFAKSANPRRGMPAQAGFDLAPPHQPRRADPTVWTKRLLHLAGGMPDLRLVPTTALARAYRRALRAAGRDLLWYGDERGLGRLRRALAHMLSAARGLAADENSLVITRGSQMALYLVARTLVQKNDLVAVEALGYAPAWDAFELCGAELHPIGVDEEGLRVDELEALCKRRRVRAIYVTPHHQYPTTVGMAAARRLELLRVARAHRVAIVEDDYDNEFHYEGRPVLPLASADEAGVVVYIGTLSKILAPGLRIGFVVAPPPVTERIAALRRYIDRQGDQVVESAAAELLEDGEVQRHVRRARRLYQSRRDALAEALLENFGGALEFEVPAGGMALWTAVDRGIDVDAWHKRALDEGVLFAPGRRFAFDGRARNFARLGFAALGENEIREAVRRMARAL